jgi:hypothetical protein
VKWGDRTTAVLHHLLRAALSWRNADSPVSAADLNLGQCHTIEHRRAVTKGAPVEPRMAFGVIIAVTRSSEVKIIGNSYIP